MNNLQKNKQEDCCGDVDKNKLAAKPIAHTEQGGHDHDYTDDDGHNNGSGEEGA